MSISLNGSDYVVHSHCGDDWKACRDHVNEKIGIPQWRPVSNKSFPNTSMNKPGLVAARPENAEYVYDTAEGKPYLKVSRFYDKDGKKKFAQLRWDGSGWIPGTPSGPKIPYKLPELMACRGSPVLIVEGEKDADRLVSLGWNATTNAGGSSGWHVDLDKYFAGCDVYLIPDNDESGEKHIARVHEGIKDIAASVRVVRLPGLREKGDVSDWLDDGHTPDELIDQINRAKPYGAKDRNIVSSADFLDGFIPPDYCIDGLIQRRFCYSLTAPTGHGKTAVALLLAASKALGLKIGNHEVDPGRVLYFVGENPDDVRMRWIALSEKMRFDARTIDVHFRPGTCKLSKLTIEIRREVEALGGVSLIIVDTSAAYSEAEEENDNVQAGNHARLMRSMVTLPGEPCVVVLCHPTKSATAENLLPRGGGAFLAEVDGNLTCWREDTLVTMHWQGKFRGSDFDPLKFDLKTVTTDRIKDSKGRPIPSVVAKTLSDGEVRRVEEKKRSDEDSALLAIKDHGPVSFAGLARALGWISAKGENRSKAQRCIERLQKHGLVSSDRNGSSLTKKGESQVERIRSNQ